MSRVYENQCVDCGLPCMGEGCRYKNVLVAYCNYCPDTVARYVIDEQDLCEDCAEEIIEEAFNNLNLLEKAKTVGIKLEKIT